MVVENVCGAQKWVGPARWHYGSYFLWGDVPALMPRVKKHVKVGVLDWKAPGDPRHRPGQAFNTTAEAAIKNAGGSWFAISHNKTTMSRGDALKENEGLKEGGRWFTKYGPGNSNSIRRTGSKSVARKMASAMIAKIPEVLSRHIARTYYPVEGDHLS